MKFEILGGGCANCDKLEALTREVVQELGVAGAEIGHVTDYAEIMRFGVMSTPALAIDGKVVVAGKVPSKGDLTSIVTSAMS